MLYRETNEKAKEYKQRYLDGLEHIIDRRQKAAEKLRMAYCANIFSDAEKYRQEFREMLGWPLVGQPGDKAPAVTAEKLSEEENFTVYRMQFEVLEGLQMAGLFFRMHGDAPKPLVIVQHGGMGTPELISGVYGDTANYNDMLMRVAAHDVHVFAPQLLLWSDEYQVPFDRKAIDARLKRVGSSITAIEVYGITRILDYFQSQSYVCSFGMVGMSYGGFYALVTAAVDTRIRSAVSCSFFNKRDAVPWSDWVWFNSASKFDDAQIACLVYPRKLYIQMGNQDDLFDHQKTVESFEAVQTLCKNVGTEWIDLTIFDGSHEFSKENTPIEALIRDLKSQRS